MSFSPIKQGSVSYIVQQTSRLNLEQTFNDFLCTIRKVSSLFKRFKLKLCVHSAYWEKKKTLL